MSGFLCACADSAAGPDGGAFALYRSLELAREIVIGADEGWAREAALRLVPQLEAELGRRTRVLPLAEAHAGPGRARILIGNAGSAACALALARLGAAIGADGRLRFRGREVLLDGHALVATLSDPEREGSVLSVFLSGASPGAALDLLADLKPTWHPGWQLFTGSDLSAQGSLAGSGAENGGEELDLDALRQAWGRARAGGSSAPRPLEEWIALDPSLASLADERSAAADRARALFEPDGGRAIDPRRTRLRVYSEPEDMARLARAWSFYRCWPRAGTLELLIAPGLPDDARAAFAELYALELAGPPAEPWLLEGFVRHAARRWWGRELEEWAAHLAAGGLVPSLEDLTARASSASWHQVAPLRGILFDVLLEERGADEVRRRWRQGGPPLDEELSSAFRRRLEALSASRGADLERHRKGSLARALARPLRHGVALVPPARRTDPLLSGLGLRACARSLARVRELGADSLGVHFDAYLERPWGAFAVEPNGRPGAQAGDVEVAATLAQARALELDVMLEPGLLISPSATRAAWALMDTPEDRVRFFDALQAHVEHYALLCELAGAEILCLGSEFGPNAIPQRGGDPGRPADPEEWKRGRWKVLIARARAAFAGALTYSARWDGEVAGFSLWSELDFVGLTLFPSLGPAREGDERPTFLDMTGRLFGALWPASNSAAESGKRLLITAIGFPSTAQAWLRPEQPFGPADEEQQAIVIACLAGVAAHWREGRGDPAGFYLWCWSADPDAGGPLDRGFTPQGKRGELALERLLRGP